MRRIPLIAFVLLLAAAAPAMAQTASEPASAHPQGWWGGVGGGFSAIRFACGDCGEEQPVYESGAAVVAVGKSIGSRVAFGVEVGGAFPSSKNGLKVTASSIGGMARFYPSQSPFYVKFSLGLSRVRAALPPEGETQTPSEIRNGTGIAFGAGYDLRVHRSFALTPYAGWYMSAIGDISSGETARHDVSWNTWTFGVGLTIF
jgi:hypothetical protein